MCRASEDEAGCAHVGLRVKSVRDRVRDDVGLSVVVAGVVLQMERERVKGCAHRGDYRKRDRLTSRRGRRYLLNWNGIVRKIEYEKMVGTVFGGVCLLVLSHLLRRLLSPAQMDCHSWK